MAVSVIYIFQAILVGSALLLPYQSDLTVVGTFIVECAIFMALVRLALHYTWGRMLTRGMASSRRKDALATEGGFGLGSSLAAGAPDGSGPAADTASPKVQLISQIVEVGFAVFLLFGALFGGKFDQDISLIAICVAGLMLFAALFLRASTYLFTRVGVYVASLLVIVAVVPLTTHNPSFHWLVQIWLGVVAVATLIGIRAVRRATFQVTPQDLLLGFFALAVPILPKEVFAGLPAGFLVISAVILFYACEYLISVANHRYILLRIATFTALLVIGVRGGLF